jgi:hypothetical protein
MNAWWKMGIALGWTLLFFFGGVYVDHKFNQAAELAAVEAQRKADADELKKWQDRAATAEKALSTERDSAAKIQQQWDAIKNEKGHTACPHSPAVIRLLQSATGAN